MLMLSILIDRAAGGRRVRASTPTGSLSRRRPTTSRDARSFGSPARWRSPRSSSGSFGRALAHGRAQVEAARAALAKRFRVPPTVGRRQRRCRRRLALDDPRRRLLPDRHALVGAARRTRALAGAGSTGWSTRRSPSPTTSCWRAGCTEDWMTLCCVSNPVGGDLIGNAYWAGVRIAPILAEAGVQRRRRRRAVALRRRLDGGYADRGAHRRTQRVVRGGDERASRSPPSTASRSGWWCRGSTATSPARSGSSTSR